MRDQTSHEHQVNKKNPQNYISFEKYDSIALITLTVHILLIHHQQLANSQSNHLKKK